MPEGNFLTGVGDLTKPATVLIEKIASATGVLYEPTRIIRKARAESEASKILAQAEVEVTDIQRRGIERLIFTEGRKQENVEAITAEAVRRLPNEARVEELDGDWLAHFFDKCSNISDSQMQSLWANLLSKEATEPSKYSKRTVNFIATMSKEEAELFANLCQFALFFGGTSPIILDETLDIYTSKNINFNSLRHLHSIGLIDFKSSGSWFHRTFESRLTIFRYFDNQMVAELPKDRKDFRIVTGKVLFTKVGRELYDICEESKNQDFLDYAVSLYTQEGIKFRPA